VGAAPVTANPRPDLRLTTEAGAKSMTDYRDHHATIFVAPAIAGPIEAVRVSAARHACPSADVGPRR
jgi:hypothetical protein